MGKNEKTSPKVATLASKVLSGEIKPTQAQAKTLAGAVLTQAPDRPIRAVGKNVPLEELIRRKLGGK